MSALPSYLNSTASSRAHHAFLVKLHHAQSEQEEHEVIRREVHRAKQELAVRGGASLSTIVETLIILLHCTVQQYRAGVFEDELDLQAERLSSSARTKQPGGEDWALLAALQVVEQTKDVRDKRIGYLYLSERLPQGHELHLMLINTIRKDLESKHVSHILLALNTIIKQPSSDLAPAVTPLLTSKPLLKHTEPAIRQRVLQCLMAVHLPLPASSATAIERRFPLSISKIIHLITNEEDHGVLCILMRLLRKILETGTHTIQSLLEKIYLVQQLSHRLRGMRPESQVAVEAVRALSPLLSAPVTAEEGDDEGMRVAMEELNEILELIVEKVDNCTGLGGALILEVCSLFSDRNNASDKLSAVLSRCVRCLGAILCPASSSSRPMLPPANDHIFAIRCLAKIPLESWEAEFGPQEMGTIMRGLESGDDSVRKATLRLLRTSVPEVLDQTYQNYLTSLQHQSDLALPLQTVADQGKKLQLAMQETALRALEVTYINRNGEGGWNGRSAAEKVYAVLTASMGLDEEESETSAWVEVVKGILDFLEYQTPAYRSEFAYRFSHLPSVPSQALISLRAEVICMYVDDDVQVDVPSCLCEDVKNAEGSDLQEKILAAILWVFSRRQGEDGDASQRIQEGLKTLIRVREMSKRIQRRIQMTLDLLSAEVAPEIRSKVQNHRKPEDILLAAEAVWDRQKPDTGHAGLSSSAHTILASGTVRPPSSIGAGIASPLRYGAYATPASRTAGMVHSHRGS